jgi:hypothetical protein
MLHLVDLPHAAPAQQADDAVLANTLPGMQVCIRFIPGQLGRHVIQRIVSHLSCVSILYLSKQHGRRPKQLTRHECHSQF